MAHDHPADSRPGESRPEGGPHPAVSLVAGFGLIILLAAGVHLAFRLFV